MEDYEKLYKEALNRAKHALDCDRNGLVSTDKPLIFSMFPELKESEDERIRKNLIVFLKSFAEQGYENATKCIDWLKKQKSVEWTKEDNEMLYVLLKGISCCKYFSGIPSEDIVNWLKSLKQKFKEE